LREGDAKERMESEVWKEGTEGLIKQTQWWKVLQIPQFEEEILGEDQRGCVYAGRRRRRARPPPARPVRSLLSSPPGNALSERERDPSGSVWFSGIVSVK
jgi:hypothetical protein